MSKDDIPMATYKLQHSHKNKKLFSCDYDYNNSSDPRYSTIKRLYNLFRLTPLFKTKAFYHLTVPIHHLKILKMVTS